MKTSVLPCQQDGLTILGTENLERLVNPEQLVTTTTNPSDSCSLPPFGFQSLFHATVWLPLSVPRKRCVRNRRPFGEVES